MSLNKRKNQSINQYAKEIVNKIHNQSINGSPWLVQSQVVEIAHRHA
jgi:hypothetical protein